MAEEKAGLAVLDPTAPPLPVNASLSARPDTLNGKVLGLLGNSKRNADKLLDEMERLLSERYEFASVVRSAKKDVTSPCPTEIMEDLVARAEVAITAIGD